MNINQDEHWKLVGHFGVDAGIVWIGDPCYVFHKERPPIGIGNSWIDFCHKLEDMKTHKSFNHDMGHEGLGVCLSTGFGDGYYPVYARIVNVTVFQIFIDFNEGPENFDEDVENEEG